jgi:hypothetical protein
MKRSLTKPTLLHLLSATIALAWFSPNLRVDREDKPTNGCVLAAITLGPGTWSSQPLYVAFEDDSTEGLVHIRSDIMFQKSTDAGRTWLPTDVLVHRGSPFATYPDITTDLDGNIYIVYRNKDSTGGARCYHCVRSSDCGATWSAPVSIDSNLGSWARIAADTAGNLFVAWVAGDVYSSVSTDKGVTWSPRVSVFHDTMGVGCWHADAFVQPGTNDYMVVAAAPYRRGNVISHHAYLYRSTDMGQTFQPGVQLDTFMGITSQPHVVAGAQHVICDYTGDPRYADHSRTEARTLYTQPDTWGSPSLVSRLDDTLRFWSYSNGAKLAISADGRVHTALMIIDSGGVNLTCYAYSSDHGASWSDLELVNDDSTESSWNPDIAADSAGHAYVVWQGGSGHVWFSTNNPAAAIAEQPPQPVGTHPLATAVRRVLYLPRSLDPSATSVLIDISGRKAMDLAPGTNDVSRLSPGVYFVREQLQAASHKPQAVRKVVVTR